MMKTPHVFRTLFWALVICGCSVEMSPVGETPKVIDTPGIASAFVFPVTRVPMTWSHLNLTGKLIYLSSVTEGDTRTSNVQMLDLATGDLATIFSADSAWIYYATVSPDAKTVVMSYAPPRQANSSSLRSLYVIPLDRPAEPKPLFTPPTPTDRYTQAEWSPDGKYIYYVHYNQDESEDRFFEDYDISRMAFPEGSHETIVEHAFWPRLSPDGSKLVYVSLDPDSGKNELFVSNADGANPQQIALSGALPIEIIDAPVFSPDGQSILFSAPEPTRSYQPNFFERLAGIQLAKAHNVPSDWWSVPVKGGAPIRLTNIQTINLFASLSPDQNHVASLSGDGIFVMDLDGSNLTQVVMDQGVHGTVSWIP